MGIDTRFIRHIPDAYWHTDGEDDLFVDAWNVPWRKRKGSYYYELDRNVLVDMDLSDIVKLHFPALIDNGMANELKKKASWAYHATDDALFSDQIGAGLFERAWYLRGFEQLLMDMMLEKPLVHTFFEHILEHQMQGYAMLFDAIGPFIEGVIITDDLATQDSLIISRQLYREMIFPYHKRLFDFISGYGKHIIYHSCGAVYPLLDDLLDAGVRILHPVQRSAANMNPRKIKQEYGKDLVIWGAGCDTAFLQTANPTQVVRDVRHTLDALASGGGFVFTPTHCIQPGTPAQNILAMAGALQGFDQSEGHELDWIDANHIR